MRVVIDTNVIVSGLLSPFGNSAEILRLLSSGMIIINYDARILIEYEAVLHRPKLNFNKDLTHLFLKEIESIGELTMPNSLKETLPDPDDTKFLEVASASTAECIITGNKSHFPKKICGDIQIFSPREFINYYKAKRV